MSATILEGFDRIRFHDPERSEQTLLKILSENRAGLREHLAHALLESPDATLALTRLERYLEVSITPRAVLDLMASALHFTRLLITVLGQSQFLTDIVCRNPEYMLWLWEEGDLKETPPQAEMVLQFVQQVRTFDTFHTRCQSMRRTKRREILRIAARDIFAHVSLTALTEDLSNLADAAVEAALVSAHADLEPRFGKAMAGDEEATFVVLGMGKLGGRELNFSSDIDLIFLYSSTGSTSGGADGVVTNAEYFHKLGERVIKAVSELTDEGNLFRVDMRLRPHGRVGSLAIDVDGAVRYYEIEGQAWERQALIKTRPIAGDLALGEAFIERTRPFVFPRYFDDETLEDIRDVKRQMEEQVKTRGETDTEVKLGRGGIRDIEFTVQMLQLLNGGRIPELRTPNTLEAIRELGLNALLKPFDATTLVSNYTFLRRVEHRLQIEGSRQQHALPTAPEELDAFAHRLGYESGVSFMVDYQDRTRETRAILDQFLATEGSGKLWVTDLLNPRSDGEAGMAGLQRLGYKDSRRARAELLALSTGRRESPNSLHVRQQFAAIAPGLIHGIAKTSDPDATLVRLSQIFANLGAPGSIFDVIRINSGLTDYLVTLVENSPFLTQLLIRDPGLFDTFGRPRALDGSTTRQVLKVHLAGYAHAVDADAAPYRLHESETLRVGMRDLIQDIGVVQIGRELTDLAEVCLEYVVEKATVAIVQRYGKSRGRFAVLGLGKFGGREMGYGSDLDLVFVYEAGARFTSDISPIEFYSTLASHVLRALKEPTRYGSLYDVDARLRPDGKKGVLAVTDARLLEYYSQEAQPWELLALTKVRAVAGESSFAHDVARSTRDIAFKLELTPQTIDAVEDVRRKIVESSTRLSLKKDEGGIAEIEFAVRLLQMRFARKHPELKRSDVLGAIAGLVDAGALFPADAAFLRDTYVLFRRIENRLRIHDGRSTSSLPEDADARADIARRLGIEGDLVELTQQRKTRVHQIYLASLGR